MRISVTEPSTVILSQTKNFKKLDVPKVPKQAEVKRSLRSLFVFHFILIPCNMYPFLCTFVCIVNNNYSVRLITLLLWWEGKDPLNRFNCTSWVTLVNQTDRPKSFQNCVIEV